MRTTLDEPAASPMRLLELLSDRFGAFETAACATVKLARVADEDALPMDAAFAEAVLQFGSELRLASRSANAWAQDRGLIAARRAYAG
jgi:hypothetical protein